MVDRASADFRSYLELYERAPLLELAVADDVRWKVASRKRRHVHHRPEHQLHECLRRRLQVLSVLSAPQAPRKGTCCRSRKSGARSTSSRPLAAVQILMQGGHNPYIPFEWYLDLLRYIKRHHPIHIHGSRRRG